MAFSDWRDATRSLRQRLELADEDQRALAKSLGFELPEGLPAQVAATVLAAWMAGPLRRGPDLPVTESQEEFLDDLVRDLRLDQRPQAASQQLAGAWIEVLVARRALEGLERERPAAGDLVEYTRYGQTSVETVSSIAADGQVYLRGTMSRRIPAHRVKVVARATDDGASAEMLRRNAANQRTRREGTRALSERSSRALENHRVADAPDRAGIELLREVVESAEDERAVQVLIERRPELLAGLTQSSWGTFVLPQVSLGGDLRPDFLIAAADSAGIQWTMVELESPRAVHVGLMNGQLGRSSRDALGQIDDWRDWLTDNLDFAVNNRGLTGIRPESPGLVIVGRRGQGPWPTRQVRWRLAQQRSTALHSYDWLLEALEHGAGVGRPGGPLDWRDWSMRD